MNLRLSICLALACAAAISPGRAQFPQASSGAFAVDTRAVRADSDGDGLVDGWEVAHGTDPGVADAGADPDGDGRSNRAEYNAGTLPLVNDWVGGGIGVSASFAVRTRAEVVDIEPDGLPDAWETLYGLQVGVNDAEADADGDGRSNLREFNDGTSPLVHDWSGPAVLASTLFLVNTGGVSLPLALDSDGDGMPDWWEVRYGLNPTLADGGLDGDGDGRINLEEFRQGYQPTVADILGDALGNSGLWALDTAGRPLDSDGDGMPDAWETLVGLNPNLPEALADPDGDGRNNLSEWNAGTHPGQNDWAGPSTLRTGLFVCDTGAFNGGYATDTDGDGMPDWWESRYGLNPAEPDAGANPDGDGLTNGEEYHAGMIPTQYDAMVLGGNASLLFLVDTGAAYTDTDGDGLPDWWEWLYYGDKLAALPGPDPDGDGRNNYAEYLTGTHPLQAADVFTAAGQRAPEGHLELRWTSFANRVYRVYAASSPSGPFHLVAGPLPATPPANVQAVDLGGHAGRFFKIEAAAAP